MNDQAFRPFLFVNRKNVSGSLSNRSQLGNHHITIAQGLAFQIDKIPVDRRYKRCLMVQQHGMCGMKPNRYDRVAQEAGDFFLLDGRESQSVPIREFQIVDGCDLSQSSKLTVYNR